MFFPFKRCIILSGQSIQAFTRTHVEVYMYYTGFPTQRGLFLLAQTINCHSYELAIPILFFLKLLSLWFNVRDLYYFFSTLSVMTQLLPGIIVIEFVQKRNSNAFFRTA